MWSLDERAKAFHRVQFYHFVDYDVKDVRQDVVREALMLGSMFYDFFLSMVCMVW